MALLLDSRILSNCNNILPDAKMGLIQHKAIRHPLLCHHPPSDYDRCVKLPFGKQQVLVCTRCFGYILTFFPLAIAQFFGLLVILSDYRFLGFLLPLPAFVDWFFSRLFTSGNNFSRLLTGAFLGVGTNILIASVIRNPLDLEIYLVVAFYFLLTIVGLILVRRVKKNSFI